MARPRKDPAAKRTETVRISLSPVEIATLKAKAERAQTNVTAFVRATALGTQIAVKPSAPADFELRQELRRIGVNLNQIAKALNAGREGMPSSLAACCEKLDAIFDRMLAHDRPHDRRP